LRDDAEEGPLRDALVFAPELFALVLDRGLLFDVLRLAALRLFEAFALEPFELRDDRCFCLLEERVFASAITPPWVSTDLGLETHTPIVPTETLRGTSAATRSEATAASTCRCCKCHGEAAPW
jgi:hypothetical protein